MAGALGARPLILAAELGAEDFAWLEGLRRRHYPAERNRVRAHLTMFHALPPSAEGEVRRSLARLATRPAPKARIEGLMNLGGGVAFRIASADLDQLRRDLAEDFHGLLGAQDSGGWRPHVTVQNKAAAKEARALLERLETQFWPAPLAISGIGLHRYLGGPWQPVAIYPFRGG